MTKITVSQLENNSGTSESTSSDTNLSADKNMSSNSGQTSTAISDTKTISDTRVILDTSNAHKIIQKKSHHQSNIAMMTVPISSDIGSK